MNQKRLIPRWKEWQPLTTQQFRLRNVIQIVGLNVGKEDLEGKICSGLTPDDSSPAVSYYYTLHLTAMSAPFYTSERIESDCPKWKEIDRNMWANSNVFGGMNAFVLRLWRHRVNDEVLTVWGVHLTGLIHLPHLGGGTLPLSPNTIIFLMPGGHYTNPESVSMSHAKSRVTSVRVPKEELRLSYSLSMIHKLSTVQQAIVQRASGVNAIKQKLSTGDFLAPDTRGSAMLRKLMSKNRPKSNLLDIAKLKDSVETARFRLQTLQEERNKVLARLAAGRGRLEIMSDSNQLKESRTMEKYRLLQREMQGHREWLAVHVQRREAQLHAKALLNFRIKQLISELHYIYPVEQMGDKFTICGVHLPDSENLIGRDELQISVGLGFVAHTVEMISVFLQVPLRYPVIHVGSRSRIVDLIADKMPDSEREFPLFCKGKDKLQFNYAVYLLNKNVAALRWLCGLPTHDLRCTLSNLASLLRLSGAEMPAEPAFRSPASSTLDLASSSFSISSPMQPCLPSRHFPHRQRLSESTVDSASSVTMLASRGYLSEGTGHSFTQAGGLPNEDPRTQLTLDASITNNLSYSLDKGLNELEEMKRKAEWMETDVALSGAAPFAMRGSESSLPVCLSRDTSRGEPCPANDAATSTFLKNWEADRNNVILSDDDSDQNNSGIFIEKTICSLEVEDRLREPIASLVAESRGEGDRVSEALEACDYSLAAPTAVDLGSEPVDAAAAVVPKPVDRAGFSSGDTLLDNVANRTEALASHSTSFNMFRSRFRSPLGST